MSLEPHQLSSGLSDMTRLRILALLQNRGELCVCQIVSSLDIPQPKVSKHLAILRATGIIRHRRQGQWMHYKIEPEIPAWASQVIHHLVTGCDTRMPYLEDTRRFDAEVKTRSCA